MSTALLALLGLSARSSRVDEVRRIQAETHEALDSLNSTLEEISSHPRPFAELVKRVNGNAAFNDQAERDARRKHLRY